ncbi:MAG: VOC family protein [Acidimicrobiales bacterium]
MDETTITAAVYYEDPKAAVDWLVDAFGLEVTMAIDGPPESPEMCHYEMALEGNGRLMVGGQWTPTIRSPRGLDGANTQTLQVHLAKGLDAHCACAREAGATITQEPTEQFYGDRTYRAIDIEGHMWTFAQHVRDVSRAEAEAALGQPITATTWE